MLRYIIDALSMPVQGFSATQCEAGVRGVGAQPFGAEPKSSGSGARTARWVSDKGAQGYSSSIFFWKTATVALLFVCDKYCSIID